MKAKSIKGKNPEEIESALKKCMADGFAPTLAIVFLSVKQDRQTICGILEKEGIAIYGATTDGEIIDSEIMEKSVAILLLDINKEYFTILFEEVKNENFQERESKQFHSIYAVESIRNLGVPSWSHLYHILRYEFEYSPSIITPWKNSYCPLFKNAQNGIDAFFMVKT